MATPPNRANELAATVATPLVGTGVSVEVVVGVGSSLVTLVVMVVWGRVLVVGVELVEMLARTVGVMMLEDEVVVVVDDEVVGSGSLVVRAVVVVAEVVLLMVMVSVSVSEAMAEVVVVEFSIAAVIWKGKPYWNTSGSSFQVIMMP